ncbi:MAG: hypothetical protein R3D03_13250 [Geminicoccaceae bacterium]
MKHRHSFSNAERRKNFVKNFLRMYVSGKPANCPAGTSEILSNHVKRQRFVEAHRPFQMINCVTNALPMPLPCQQRYTILWHQSASRELHLFQKSVDPMTRYAGNGNAAIHFSRISGSIRLCQYQDRIRIVSDEITSIVVEQKTNVGTRGPFQRTTYSFSLDRVIRVTQSRRIQQADRQAVQIEVNFNDIPCRARRRRNDGDIAPSHCVHKTRFAHIGPTDNCHRNPVSQTLTGTTVIECRSQILDDRIHVRPKPAPHSLRNFVVGREIDFSLDHGQHVQDFLSPRLRTIGKLAGYLRCCLVNLIDRGGIYEIRYRLRPYQIQLAVQIGAFRQFSGIGHATKGGLSECGQKCLSDPYPAMMMNFEHVFTGETFRTGEEQ